MKRWTRKEMAVTLRSIPVRVGVAFYLVVLASGVAAGFADPELRSIRLELFRSVQVVLLALTVPWIVARLTERRGSEFVLELALTVSRGATALLAKAVALVVLVATLLTLSIPFAMIVFVSTTIPSGGVIAWYAGFLGFRRYGRPHEPAFGRQLGQSVAFLVRILDRRAGAGGDLFPDFQPVGRPSGIGGMEHDGHHSGLVPVAEGQP